MNCACGGEGRVIETRERTDGSMRRSRKCEKCGERWTTIEARVPNRPKGDVHVLIVSTGELAELRRSSDALQLLFNPRLRFEQRPKLPEVVKTATRVCVPCNATGIDHDGTCAACGGSGYVPAV